MERTQLKNTALALWGFVPEWSTKLCDEIVQRIEAAGVLPAVYLRAVATNKKVPSSHLVHRNVILSRKWDDFLNIELQQMQEEARVKFDSDKVEFRNALLVCRGDYKESLEDLHFNLTNIGRYSIALLYGLEETAEKFRVDAEIDRLRNPYLAAKYDELQEDDNVE